MTSALNPEKQPDLRKGFETASTVVPDSPFVPDYSYGLGQNTVDARKQIRNVPKYDVKWAVMAATWTQAVNGGTQMAFDAFTWNDAAMLDDANDRITVTKAWIYQITAQIYCGSSGLVYSGISIDVNGTQEAIEFTQISTGVDRAMRNVAWVWFLSVGDHITATGYGGTTEAGVKKNWVRVFQLASKTT